MLWPERSAYDGTKAGSRVLRTPHCAEGSNGLSITAAVGAMQLRHYKDL